jgi:hypothetical protein
MPASTGTHGKVEMFLMLAVGPGLRRDDEKKGIKR